MARFCFFPILLACLTAAGATNDTDFTVEEGPDWVAFDYLRDIEPGSALDFSSVVPTDAPAGRHGWLKAVGDHFEFEGLPGRSQRFYGINLCMSLNYPSHDEAETMITRFRRIGYNAIRIHHHDKGSVENSKDGLTLNAANMDRLDYLIATAVSNGLYVTTDLYVSRSVKWRQIGIDRDGFVNSQGYKTLTVLHEPAFRDWQTHASNFLFHVNAYTGRRYVDEPALALLVTVNENWMSVGWKHVKDVPECDPPYQRWKAGKIARYGDGFMSGSLKPSFDRLDPWKDNAATSLFFAEMEAAAHERRARWLREIGVKTPLSAGNHGPDNAPNQMVRARCYDYVDDHSYEDHPTYLNKVHRYQLPKKCANRDFLDPDAFNALSMNRKAFSRVAGKPFVSSEWNCCGPSEYRQVGGLYGGALFAAQDWGGVWRFAYAHNLKHLADQPREPGAFDVSADPIMVAQERQIAALYLRRDLGVLSARVNFVVDDAALTPPPDPSARNPLASVPAQPRRKENLMFAARVSCGTERLAGAENFRLFDYARSDRPVPFADGRDGGAVVTDFSNRVFAVATARTCGIAGATGTVRRAGALAARIVRARAAVSAIALDGRPLESSGRILVSHLTDAKGRGAQFTRTADGLIHRSSGDGTILLRNGEAEIALRAASGSWKAYALASTGARRFEVPVRFENGLLHFTARVRGTDGRAVMEYEIARD